MANRSALCLFLFLLAITILSATSARLLDQVDPLLPAVLPTPTAAPLTGPTTTLPSGQVPATTVFSDDDNNAAADAPLPDVVDDVAPVATPVADVPAPEDTVAPPVPIVAPAAAANVAGPAGPAAANVAPVSATAAIPVPEHPTVAFFMHDILGGSHPSARVVTGIIANSDVNGLPFSKSNNNFFPVSGAVPLQVNGNLNGLLNNNNLPFLAGLNGAQPSTLLQNSGNNNVVTGGGNQPFVTAGQLPAGATLQKIMFGSTTVVDDELTEGHELGSAVIGRAQGFYMASSLDGTSQTVALTALFHGGEHDHLEDTISFFGVHRTASHESQVAVIGGTGKYENAKGYATIQSVHHEDQHTTDGTDTILEFNVYLF